jgi:hypothetical protein
MYTTVGGPLTQILVNESNVPLVVLKLSSQQFARLGT